MNERIKTVLSQDIEPGSKIPDQIQSADIADKYEGGEHKSLFSISVEDEQKLIELGNKSKLVEAHMRAASNLVYKQFSGIARAWGISLADLESEAFATIAECAETYMVARDKVRNIPFYAFYKPYVIGRCKDFIQKNKSIVPLSKAGRKIRNAMIRFIEARGGRLVPH